MNVMSRKAFNRKFEAEVIKQLEKDVNKQLDEEREEIAYNAFVGAAPNTVRQTEAMMLYALSLNGYGAKRLNAFHEWFRAICNMPSEIMGKKNQAIDCVNYMRKKYGIDFDAVKVNLPTYEEYLAQQKEQDGSP